MKRMHIILTLAVAVLTTACQKPQYIEPTAERQALTSLTAIFTFGPYVDQEMAKLVIDDDEQTRFEIPVPYYFPASSDDQTDVYMVKARVQAELQPDCTLTPALGVLDLTEENYFTLRDYTGKERRICITGVRKKSSECEIMSFNIVEPAITGIVDKGARTVTLITVDDVTSCTAEVAVSAHATVSPDPSVPRDYTEPVEFTVTAHDGTTGKYTVKVGIPEKIESGFNPSSVELLFNIDPVTFLGLPAYDDESVAVSIAACGNTLIICPGNGTTPVAVNRLTGALIGDITLGDAEPGSVTNDETGHLLITNVAEGGQEVSLYMTASATAAPVLFHTFTNPVDIPIGHKMKVMGDLSGDAVITFTAEGIDGVTTSSKAVYLTVTEGAVASVNTVDFTSTGLAWGSAPVNTATVIPVSTNPAVDGWMLNYYEGGTQTCDGLHWIDGSLNDALLTTFGGDNAWAYNANCLDSKTFNHVRYGVQFVVSHFPAWGCGPMLYMYDITSPSAPAEVLTNDAIFWYQTGSYDWAAGDVVIAPSADGFKIYVYYYDHNSQAVGGYVADCIKR